VFPVELGRFIYWVLFLELLKVFAHHRNDSTLMCIIHIIYVLGLEDVIGRDVGSSFFGTHCI